MNVDHVLTAHLEVAQSDAWERHVTQLGPVLARQHVTHDLEAERLVLAREDQVQQEQLADHVADVEELRDQKQHHQVVAQPVDKTSDMYNTIQYNTWLV